MSNYKNRSRSIARERYWEKHDKSSYTCPDCGRTEKEIPGTLEVHHKAGNAYDNSLDNLVGLCNLCHCLREEKKPPIREIKALRDSESDVSNESLEIPHIVWCFIDDRVQKALDTPYVNPFSVWWNEWENYAENSAAMGIIDDPDVSPATILAALEQVAGAEIRYADDGYPTGAVEVWGVQLS